MNCDFSRHSVVSTNARNGGLVVHHSQVLSSNSGSIGWQAIGQANGGQGLVASRMVAAIDDRRGGEEDNHNACLCPDVKEAERYTRGRRQADHLTSAELSTVTLEPHAASRSSISHETLVAVVMFELLICLLTATSGKATAVFSSLSQLELGRT